MNFLLPKIFIFLFTMAIVSCASNVINKDSITRHMNSLVGNIAPDYTKMKYWSEINNTELYRELELKRPDGCSYAILVEKNTNIVKSWRFTSDEALCDKDIGSPRV
jgi:hypothetical protein